MIKLINNFGGFTWVDESRVDEYLSLGHKLAEVKKAEPTKPKAEPKKTTRKPARKR